MNKKEQINVINNQLLAILPPIKKTFSPEMEVQNLLSVPHDQRRQAVSDFKSKLARQRVALALCRAYVEERIEANPDLTREEMIGIVREFASHYGFPENYVDEAESLIDKYREMHERVKEIRGKHPNDRDLIESLTGMRIFVPEQPNIQDDSNNSKHYEVKMRPISFEIYCSLYNLLRFYYRSENPDLSDLSKVMIFGFTSSSATDPKIRHAVIAKGAMNYLLRIQVAFHELQHIKNHFYESIQHNTGTIRDDVREQLDEGFYGFIRKILEKVFLLKRNLVHEVYLLYKSTNDPDKKAFFLEEYMRLKREEALNKVKGEIFAMKIEPYVYTRWDNSSSLFEMGGDYDFLEDVRDYNVKDDPLWQEIAQKVLFKEYRQIINNAIKAFDLLTDNGYPIPLVIAMLSDKRLSEWPKTVRRLLEQKEIRR